MASSRRISDSSASGTPLTHVEGTAGGCSRCWRATAAGGSLLATLGVTLAKVVGFVGLMLVVGRRGRAHATGTPLGSVSHAVLHYAPCPVLLTG